MDIVFNQAQIKAAAIAICQACGENPHHTGDARGNNYRWQDYLEIAEAGLTAAIEAGKP
jgi:hypothetical protein